MNFKKEFRKLNEMSDEEVEKVYKNTNYNYLKVIANIKNLEQ